MNQSRFRTLASAAAALATQMALASGAQAKVTEVENGGVTAVENDGVLTEVYDLTVDGTSYDVTFSSTPGGIVFPTYETMDDTAGSQDAAKALGNELKSLGFPIIAHCPSSPGWSCELFIRDNPSHNVVASILTVTSSMFSVTADVVRGGPEPLYAVWTSGSSPPALTPSVPEPPPAALLGIGMAGVAGARALRRKKKK